MEYHMKASELKKLEKSLALLPLQQKAAHQ
jgi:hypothetical protein